MDIKKTENLASASGVGGDTFRAPRTGPTVNISTMPPSHALTEIVTARSEPPQELPVYSLASPEQQRGADDAALQAVLTEYLAQGKGRTVDPSLALAFVKEQQRQLAKPEKEQDWAAAKRLYLDMQGITPEEMKAVEGGVFKGGWIGSGTVYGLSGQLANFLSVVPSIYTASVSTEELKKHPVHYAALNLGMQLGFSVITPFLNAAIQIPMVARQELMRAKGQPARSKEMKAPLYPKTMKEMDQVVAAMNASTATMEAHSEAIERLKGAGKVDTPEWQACMRQMEADGDAAVALMSRHTDLLRQFQVRKDVTELNYVSQYYPALVRTARVLGTLAGQVVGTATRNAHLSAHIQIGTALATMGVQQFWAMPKGQFAKQNDTLMATIRSTRLIEPEQGRLLASGGLSIDDLREDHLDLADVPKQWTRGAVVGLGQFKEYLGLNVQYCEQNLADLVKMDPHEWRQLEALEAKAGGADVEQGRETPLSDAEDAQRLLLRQKATPLARTDGSVEKRDALRQELAVLKQDLAHIKSDEWLSLSPENRRILLRSVDGKHEWETAFRTALVRMRLPSDFIPQVAQRVGAQFQMVFAGSNMPLIVSAVLRLVQAGATEAHRAAVGTLAQAPGPLSAMAPVVAAAPTVAAAAAPVLSNGVRYTISSLMSVIGVAGAFSSGALVNDKITQRAELRKAAADGKTPRVGFQLGLASRAMRAIGRAMVVLPTSINDRVRIEIKAREGKNTQARLQGHMDRLRDQLAIDGQGASSSGGALPAALLPAGQA